MQTTDPTPPRGASPSTAAGAPADASISASQHPAATPAAQSHAHAAAHAQADEQTASGANAIPPISRPPCVVLIAALDRKRGIGKNNALLWHLPEDLQHFKRTTLGCPILMGRKTWDSIGRPLPGRLNVVITQNPNWRASGAEVAHSLADALARVAGFPKVFVIGGGQIYCEALPLADALCLTEVDTQCDADTFFPEWSPAEFTQTRREAHQAQNGLRYAFADYARLAPKPAC